MLQARQVAKHRDPAQTVTRCTGLRMEPKMHAGRRTGTVATEPSMSFFRRSIIPGLAVLLVLAACVPAATDATPSATPLVTGTPTPTPAPSLVVASEQPVASGTPLLGTARITGVLGADSIEGGCGYLLAADGTRYQVMYPDGWELSLSPLELRDPDGTVVATGGDEVTVSGEIATDMASICQIGPIFRADSVLP